MEFKERDSSNYFYTIVTGDWNEDDYVTMFSPFRNDEYDKVLSFIVLLQDIYNKRSELELSYGLYDIREEIEEYIGAYVKSYFKLDGLDYKEVTEIVLEEFYELLPSTGDGTYYNIGDISNITIIKGGRVFNVGEPNDEDIKEAIAFVTDYVKEINLESNL